jgi:hypothetical protein
LIAQNAGCEDVAVVMTAWTVREREQASSVLASGGQRLLQLRISGPA